MTRRISHRLAGLYFGWRMIAVSCKIRVLGGGLHAYGLSVFFLPLTQELGLSRTAASLVFSLARAQGALEGPVAGYYIDRYGPRPVVTVAVVAIYCLFRGKDPWQLWIAMPLFCLFEGLFPLTWATVGDFFGRRNFGKIRGSMSFLYIWSSMLGPVLAGAIYDRTQSYDWLFWWLLGTCGLTTLLYLILGPPKARRATVSRHGD